MKKTLQVITLAALSALPAGAVLAIDSGSINNPEPATNVDLKQAIVNVINIILGIAGALAVLFLVIGGIRYIVSAGNSDQIESARHTIFNAVIGIVVILLAVVVVNTLKTLTP